MAEPGFPRWAAAVLGLVALVAPLVAPNDYWIGVLTRICLYATLALGLNIVVGFAGLLDLGYVAFFGIGSYLYAFLASPHFGLHLPFPLAVPIVVVLTALSGILIGAPTLRLRGDYLAIVTLGFGEITYLLLINLDRPINITVAKLQAFAIGASFAGIGGSFLASWQRSVFPENFLFTESINILAMVILGGMGNLLGVVVGATLLVSMPEVFRDLQRYRLLAFGLMLMVLMVFRPQGLLTSGGRREEEPEPVAEQEAGAGM